MRIWKNECVKVWFSPVFWLVLAVLLLINGVLLYTKAPDVMMDASVYQKAYAYYLSLSEDERLREVQERTKELKALLFAEEPDELEAYDQYVKIEKYQPKFAQDAYQEYSLLQEFEKQLRDISGYETYLEGIRDKAKRQSGIVIFQNESRFSRENARKTAAAFEPLAGTHLVFVNSHTFHDTVDFPGTDFMVLCLLFYMVLLLVAWERERGLTALLFPLLRGRRHLIAAKMGALFCGSVFANLVFWGMNAVLATAKYGPMDWDVPIQSVSGYIGCALPVTAGEYLLLFVMSKILICYEVSLILVFFTLYARRTVMLYIQTALLFGASFGLYQLIDGNSVFQLVKYINLIPFLRVNSIYRYYFNVSLLSHPVNMISLYWGMLALLAVMLICLNLHGFAAKRLAKVPESIGIGRNKNAVRGCSGGLFSHEGYKCLVMQRAFVILAVFAALQIYLGVHRSDYISVEEQYYRQYMERLKGPVTRAKTEVLKKEQERLLHYDTMLSDARKQYKAKEISAVEWNAVQRLVSDQTKNRSAFQRVVQRFWYLRDYAMTHRKNLGFVYETGYDRISGHSYEGYRNDMINAALLMMVTIAAFSAVFPVEYNTGMIWLLSCSPNGGLATVHKKLLLGFAMSAVMFVMAYLPDFIYTVHNYGFPSLSAPCAAVPSLSAFGEMISLGEYLLLLLLLRGLCYLCLWMTVFAVSVMLRDTMKTMVFCTLLIVFPLLIHLAGIEKIDVMSFNMFLSGNMYLDYAKAGYAPLILIPIAFGAGAYRVLRTHIFREL
ncbi:hypothetical protein MCG98_08135 [Ruminococcus sp. OA3]|uniref:hypothetical protein n=1 Tax=Ruminococcus sp. OA3 TaxID=2914164 RepID=UPI001F06A49D|nr:hypothetical protein [Ruminococcus sp. OA3]MCH1982533.1 hypothetical protein [Ruminococcus sp. OA3]